jgi:phosphoribosylanthranilate isomerase
MSVRIKICGITRIEDAHAAVEAGADALGFMFYPPSKRNISAATARSIIASLPPFVSRVGVFVDATEEQIRSTAIEAGIDTVQLHGSETPEFCRALHPYPVIKAFRVRGPESMEELARYQDVPWLLDSFSTGALGGTGKTFDWDLAASAVSRGGRVILAGGLSSSNVTQAIQAVHPWAVDVSSGVESAPGRKDAGLLSEFVKAVRRAG